jgi:hypothetical protein
MSAINIKQLNTARQKAFQYLEDCHEEYGHFPLFDFFPEFEEKKDRGWHYSYRSPFIHSSTLDALLNAGYDMSSNLVRNAVQVLLDFREPGDLWRFWNVNEAEYPTFSDVDETAISSFALKKANYQLNNQKILYSRIKKNGEIPTWINADLKILLTSPYVYFWLKYHNRKVSLILNDLKWIALDDVEPCIVANVLAYLGENEKTQPSINYVIKGWINDKKENYQHYDQKIILAFHISRAYKEGVKSLFQLKESIIAFITSSLSSFSFPEILMGYLSIYYFDKSHLQLDSLKKAITKNVCVRNAYQDPYPYTTEKKKIYYGGSGALTAAWFLEVLSYWQLNSEG